MISSLSRTSAALALFFVLAFFAGFAFGESNFDSTLSWVAPAVQATIVLDSNYTPSPGSSSSFSAILEDANGFAIDSASVSAAITKPDGNVSIISFSGSGDGNYSGNFLFDTNGIFTMDINAVDEGNTVAVLTDYFYVGKFSMHLSPTSSTSLTASSSTALQFFLHGSPPVKHATGSISITNPDGSSFKTGVVLEASTAGNYYYSFTAPSTNGTYSYTLTLSLGENSASYSGNFTVTGGSSGDEGSGSHNNNSGNGGGGGGGGGSFPDSTSEYSTPSVFAESVSVSPLEVGKEARIFGTVRNNSDKKVSVVVQAQIRQDSELEFVDEEKVLEIKPNSKAPFSLGLSWTPKTSGQHTLEVNLYSLDKKTRFDSQVKSLDLSGELRYDLGILCTTPEVTAGLPAYFVVSISNTGTYYNDLQLSWTIEDSKGMDYAQSGTPIAIRPNENSNRQVTEVIPRSAPAGIYFARAKIEYSDSNNLSAKQERNASCSFTVLSQKDYYTKVLNALNSRVSELENELNGLKGRGFETQGMIQELGLAKQSISLIAEKVSEGKFDEVNNDILLVSRSLDLVDKESSTAGLATFSAEQLSPLFLMIATAFAIFAGGFLVFKTVSRRKSSVSEIRIFDEKPAKFAEKTKSVKSNSTLDWLLGLRD